VLTDYPPRLPIRWMGVRHTVPDTVAQMYSYREVTSHSGCYVHHPPHVILHYTSL